MITHCQANIIRNKIMPIQEYIHERDILVEKGLLSSERGVPVTSAGIAALAGYDREWVIVRVSSHVASGDADIVDMARAVIGDLATLVGTEK